MKWFNWLKKKVTCVQFFFLYDLGVEHKNKVCAGCKEKPICGVRFQCTTCSGSGIDLCTKCYMSDKHDTSHTFARYDTEKSSP